MEENDEEEYSFTLFSDCRKLYLETLDTSVTDLGKVFQDENGLVSNKLIELSNEDDVPLSERLRKKQPYPRNQTTKVASCRRRKRSAEKSVNETPPCRNRYFTRRRAQRKEEVQIINLDSDDDEGIAECSEIEPKECTDNPDDTSSNEVISVKICWMLGRIHRFQLRKYQKIGTLYRQLAELENVSEDNIVLILHDAFIKPNDTPDSLKLTIADIIEGGIVQTKKSVPATSQNTEVDENSLEFKLLLQNQKKPMLVSINKHQKMKLVMIKCSEQLEVPLERLKFSFDGEELDDSLSPVDLDMEGGECIDVVIKE